MKSFYNKIISVAAVCLLLVTCCSVSLYAQIPDRPEPQKLVNDLSGILTQEQVNMLESKLVAFADSTSNQIVIVFVPELYGMSAQMLSYEIGEKWGVGQKKFNNGLVILVKPKTVNERGEAFISVGYGLEGVLPDALAKKVVDSDMIPYFRNNDYFGGVDNTVNVLMPLLAGEISTDEFAAKRSSEDDDVASAFGVIFIVIFGIIIFLAIFSKNNGSNLGSGNKGGRGKNLSAWDLILLGSILNNSGSGRSSSGSFGGGGFGSGGFGGFGGGSFGGGGAGGSW